MRNFFDRRDPRGHGPALWLLAGVLFCVPLALVALRDLRLEHGVPQWLPPTDPNARAFSALCEQFPGRDSVLVSWEGSTLDDPRITALVMRLRGRVDRDGVRRGGVPHAESVLTPHNLLAQFVEQGVSEREALQRLEGVMIGAGRVKVRLTDAGRAAREQTIRDLVARAQTKLGLAVEIVDAIAPWASDEDVGDSTDPLAETDAAAAPRVALSIPEHDFQVGWSGLRPNSSEAQRFRELALRLVTFPTLREPDGQRLVEDCFIAPGSPVAMAVKLSEAGEADRPAAMAAIRQAARDVGFAETDLHLGGPLVEETELTRSLASAAWDAEAPLWMLHRRSVLLAAALVAAALSFLLLRNVRMALVVTGVVCPAALLGAALASRTGDSLGVLLVVLPALILTLALSTAVSLLCYWRHAALDNGRTALAVATEMVRRPVFLAGVISTAAMLPFLVSSRAPIRQFGTCTMLGCLLALALAAYTLPSLWQVIRLPTPRPNDVNRGRWHMLAALLCRFPGWTSAVCVLLLIAAASQIRVETSAAGALPGDPPLVQDRAFFNEGLAGATPLETIVRFSLHAQQKLRFLERVEIVREAEQELRRDPAVSGALSLADFLPIQSPPAADASTRQRVVYNRQSNEAERRIRGAEASGSTDFLSVVSRPEDATRADDAELIHEGDELWRIRVHAALAPGADAGRLASELDGRIQSVLRYHPGAEHFVTGAAVLSHAAQRTLLTSLLWRTVIAIVMVGIALLCVLRSPRAALLTLLCLLFPAAMALGVSSWCGRWIGVADLVTTLFALLFGVQVAAHLLTAFRDGLDQGWSRSRAVAEAMSLCGPAVWLTSLPVGIGLLTLASSDALMISRLGGLSGALLGATVFGQLVFLPALLAGPLGVLLERRAVAARTAESADEAAAIPTPHLRLKTVSQPDVARHAG